jgi:septal ring factor EnvC (AmiA/AmiB activator)
MGTFSPTSLYEFLGIVGFLIGILVGIKSLRTPRLQDQFVAKTDYERDRTETREELKRHATSRKSIYEKLEDQAKSISAIETSMEQHGKDLVDLTDEIKETNNRIDAIPTRVIGLLKETKGLI